MSQKQSPFQQKLSKVSLGAWGIGGVSGGATSYGDISEEAAIECVKTAINGGITHIDTAPPYGDGKSEIRIGKALKQSEKRPLIASKAGLTQFENKDWNHSAEFVLNSVDQSLERLQLDHIELLHLYNPPVDVFEKNPGLKDALLTLQQQGKIGEFGMSVKSPTEAVELIDQMDFSAIMVNFNMLDLRALECGLLDMCDEKGVAVLARTPLCFGFLSLAIDENTEFEATDHRSNWPKEQLKRWTDAAKIMQDIAANLDPVKDANAASRALRFCLAAPAVKSVVVGATTVDETNQAIDAMNQPSLPTEILKEVSEMLPKLNVFG